LIHGSNFIHIIGARGRKEGGIFRRELLKALDFCRFSLEARCGPGLALIRGPAGMNHPRSSSTPRLLHAARVAASAVLLIATPACIGHLGGDDGAGATPPDATTPAGYAAAEAVLPRLTSLQYRSSLHDLLSPAVPQTPTEPDTNPYLFDSIGATTTTLSELGVQQYEEAADAASLYVFGDPLRRAAFVGCAPAAPGDACVTGFLERFGRRVLRRPLSATELQRWTGVATSLSQPDAWEGLRLAVAGLLQSPYFIYRVELGAPDANKPGQLRLTGYETASRLSFLLWNTTPDDELLDAAGRGDFESSAGVAIQAARLLEDPRATATVRQFFAQFLDLGRLDGVTRDAATYPLYSDGIVEAMRTEVEMIVDDVVANRRDARSIFSTRRTFVNSQLAALYDVEAKGADEKTFVAVDLDPAGPRRGILTLGAFLTMNAHETDTSPTARGKYIRERVLCQTVAPPPPNVNTTLAPPPEGKPLTVRERMEEHRKNPACTSCHTFMDPPGFLFEHFDSLGVYRTSLPGPLPVDSSGDLDGKPLDDATGLTALLQDDPRVGACMVKQLYRYAHGRLDTKGEKAALEELDARFAETGYDFRQLIIELVTHESFRAVAVPQESP
jgi:uncharacterized protein DUF1592/uncharacterized protein DUF1588/uncharacterized protein DUF1595/uncharacterized protein DUF1585/uncharacterized protein DUF1587